MKIAFLAFSSLPLVGGSQVFLHNIVRELLDRSHEVHLFLPYRYYRQYVRLYKHRKLRVFPILCFEGFVTKYFSFVICGTLLLRQVIHRYHVWQVIGAYPAGFVSRFVSRSVPVVLRSHGDDIQKSNLLNYGSRMNPLVEKKIISTLSSMTRLVALTDTVAECYRDLGVPDEKIIKIPNGVDLLRFQKLVDREKVRSTFGLCEGESFLLTTGRYHLKKGYEYIPNAAKLLKAKGYDFKWIIVGKGVEKLEVEVKRMCVDDTVILIEGLGVEVNCGRADICSMPPPSLIDLYKSADIFVMPSLLETFGMVLIEAMAAGLAVVTTDGPGCRDVVIHEVNGLQSRAGDVYSLVGCIERLFTDKILVNKLKSNALDFVKDYGWSNIARRYEELFYNLIDHSKETE